jgi:metallo-beta-lactamase family protein
MKIEFLGAAQEVTGSSYWVTGEGFSILVDCGLFQGSHQDEARNREPFHFTPGALDAVIFTHAHLDHCGRLPLLVKSGFRGPIYTHPTTQAITGIMLKDSAHLSEKDAEYENKKRHLKGPQQIQPLYTFEEVEKTLSQMVGVAYQQKKEILPGVSLRFQDAGHILGSSILELWLCEGEKPPVKIVFSGDLGHCGTPILEDPKVVEEADVVMMECTYGDRNHKNWEESYQELKDVFLTAKREKGNILIPVFALGRTQEILYLFQKHYEDWGIENWQVFLDSPMAIDVTAVYDKAKNLYDDEAKTLSRHISHLFSLPNLTLTDSTEASMALNTIQSGAIILAGSGMCNGGRIRHHIRNQISRHGTHLLLVGFQARGTLGRLLVDGVKEVKLWGETYPVRAKIHTIGGLSAHADQDHLVQWYQNFKGTPPLILVHGELAPMKALADRIQLRASEEGANRRPLIRMPSPRERISLTDLLQESIIL